MLFVLKSLIRFGYLGNLKAGCSALFQCRL